jgi:hypothetical protein
MEDLKFKARLHYVARPCFKNKKQKKKGKERRKKN